VFNSRTSSGFKLPSNKLHPFAPITGLWPVTAPAVQVAGRPGFPSTPLPACIGRDFNTTTESSATPHRIIPHLAYPLGLTCPADFVELRHEASPVKARSLCTMPSSSTPTGQTRHQDSRYFGRLPSRVVESGSLSPWTVHFLSLPSDPAVTSSALAIRIGFPLVGVTPAYRRLGLPAMPGKQKKAGSLNPALRFQFIGKC